MFAAKGPFKYVSIQHFDLIYSIYVTKDFPLRLAVANQLIVCDVYKQPKSQE